MIDGRAAIRDTQTQLTRTGCKRVSDRFGSGAALLGAPGPRGVFKVLRALNVNVRIKKKEKKRKSRALRLHLHRGEYIKENGGGLIANSSFSSHYNQARPTFYAPLSRPGLTR